VARDDRRSRSIGPRCQRSQNTLLNHAALRSGERGGARRAPGTRPLGGADPAAPHQPGTAPCTWCELRRRPRSAPPILRSTRDVWSAPIQSSCGGNSAIALSDGASIPRPNAVLGATQGFRSSCPFHERCAEGSHRKAAFDELGGKHPGVDAVLMHALIAEVRRLSAQLSQALAR
jgi:hypothetical protein